LSHPAPLRAVQDGFHIEADHLTETTTDNALWRDYLAAVVAYQMEPTERNQMMLRAAYSAFKTQFTGTRGRPN
jgi:hypothetical protein